MIQVVVARGIPPETFERLMEVKRIVQQKHGDERGMLIALEEAKNVPFAIKRVYYLFDTKDGVRRGFHAHRNLKQLAIAVRGSVRFHLDDGFEQAEVLLDDPVQGLYLDHLIWREMYDFSEDCVLMVLADQLYDPDDYIRDYDEFISIARGGKV
jgi:dTDP-4-dehydrorhamnose 3,5-epimerase-like enzyme